MSTSIHQTLKGECLMVTTVKHPVMNPILHPVIKIENICVRHVLEKLARNLHCILFEIVCIFLLQLPK